MTILSRIVAIFLGLAGAIACGMAWLVSPYAYAWSENLVLARQADSDSVGGIMGFAAIGLVLEVVAMAIYLLPGANWKIWPHGLAPLVALLVAAACVIRFVAVKDLPAI